MHLKNSSGQKLIRVETEANLLNPGYFDLILSTDFPVKEHRLPMVSYQKWILFWLEIEGKKLRVRVFHNDDNYDDSNGYLKYNGSFFDTIFESQSGNHLFTGKSNTSSDKSFIGVIGEYNYQCQVSEPSSIVENSDLIINNAWYNFSKQPKMKPQGLWILDEVPSTGYLSNTWAKHGQPLLKIGDGVANNPVFVTDRFEITDS